MYAPGTQEMDPLQEKRMEKLLSQGSFTKQIIGPSFGEENLEAY